MTGKPHAKTARKKAPAKRAAAGRTAGEPRTVREIAAGARAQSARKTSAKPDARTADEARTKAGQASSWSDAERAEFVRATLEAGPHGPLLKEALAEQTKWTHVLGEDLAQRIGLACIAAGEDPGPWCLRQLADAVGVLERQVARRAETTRSRAKCQHPEKDRHGGRCGACGTRGLPAL